MQYKHNIRLAIELLRIFQRNGLYYYNYKLIYDDASRGFKDNQWIQIVS